MKLKIGKTQSGIRFARYSGFVAIGKTAGEAYNNLLVLYHGANCNGNNTISAKKNGERVSVK